jgi:hypothetical protein
MAKHTVNVPDYATSSRQKMTAGQWLAEFRQREAGEKSQVLVLPDPIRLCYVETRDNVKVSTICRTSTGFFRMLERLAFGQGVITGLTWRGRQLGAVDLFALNFANRTKATRKNGLNIVRWWLENRAGHRTPLRADVAAFFSYLEIRPLLRGKTAGAAVSVQNPASVSTAQTLDIMSIIHASRY